MARSSAQGLLDFRKRRRTACERSPGAMAAPAQRSSIFRSRMSVSSWRLLT